jgi:hypothetical protein
MDGRADDRGDAVNKALFSVSIVAPNKARMGYCWGASALPPRRLDPCGMTSHIWRTMLLMSDLNDIEQLVSVEQRPHSSTCGMCHWLAGLPIKQRQKWHSVLWDGRDESGRLNRNRRWQTQAIQRAVLKLAPQGFPKSTVEGHRKQAHETPGIDS